MIKITIHCPCPKTDGINFHHLYLDNLFLFSLLYREIALTVTLINGGLELDASQLIRLSHVVARLTLLPCVAEAVAAGIAAYYILPDFSWEWSLTLGCV